MYPLKQGLSGEYHYRQNRCLLLHLLVMAMLVFTSLFAQAHESRPLYIELKEINTELVQLLWKTPASVPLFNTPSVHLNPTCQTSLLPTRVNTAEGILQKIIYKCPDNLQGQTVNIHYPVSNPSISSLIYYYPLQGERHFRIMGPQETQWTVAGSVSETGIAKQYVLLGIEHIMSGPDHLLFILCLLWIAATPKRILITITGFTIAHSITLILSSLQYYQPPIAPVEACIALSIVFLATEIAKGRRQSLTWRYPIAVSSTFGLLHGFGFAAALGDIGLPQSELLSGLLFFNLGVEIGQIIFAIGIVSLALILRTTIQGSISEYHLSTTSRLLTSYLVGILASYWLAERISGFVVS